MSLDNNYTVSVKVRAEADKQSGIKAGKDIKNAINQGSSGISEAANATAQEISKKVSESFGKSLGQSLERIAKSNDKLKTTVEEVSKLALKTKELSGQCVDAAGQMAAVGEGAEGAATAVSGMGAALAAALPVLIAIAAVAAKIFVIVKLVQAQLKIAGKMLKTVFGVVKDVTVLMGRYTKAFMEAFGTASITAIKGVGSALQVLGKIIIGLKDNAKEGLTVLYEWSKKSFANSSITKTADSLDILTSCFYSLNNAVGAAVAPLITTFAPAIQSITQLILNLVNVFNLLIAALTGSSGFYKATMANKKFADSAGSAAKEVNKLTAGIDELNVLNDDSGSGSGVQVTGAEFKYEEISKLAGSLSYLYGVQLNKLLLNAFDAIDWNSIKGKARQVGIRITLFLVGALRGVYAVKDLGTEVGNFIAQSVNTGIEFFKGLLETNTGAHPLALSISQFINNSVFTAFSTFDYEGLNTVASKLVEDIVLIINKFFQREQESQTIGTGLANLISTGINAACDFITGLDFTAIIDSISNGLSAVIEKADTTKISNAITTLLDASFELLSKMPFESLLQKVGECIGNILSWGIEKLKGSDPTAVAAKISSMLLTFVDAIGPDRLAEFINTFTQWFEDCWDAMATDVDWQKLGDEVGEFLEKVDWNKVLDACFRVIEGLWTFVEIFVKSDTFDILAGKIADALRAALKKVAAKMLGVSDTDNVGQWIAKGIAKYLDTALSFFNPFGGLISPFKAVINALEAIWEEFTDSLDVSTVSPSGGGGSHTSGSRTFASGGFPTTGQMFIAREAGPELVGTIGGSTAVANNDQIVSAVSTGVYNAVVSAMSQSNGTSNINVFLDGKQIEASVRGTAQQRGAVIASGGVLNFAY